jgi:hypothetical protein
MILAMGFESTYVERSGLTQEEKAGARVTVARYASGLASSKIPNECVFLDGSGDAHFASGSRQRIPGDRVKTAHILDMTWPYVTEDGRRRFKAAMTH